MSQNWTLLIRLICQTSISMTKINMSSVKTARVHIRSCHAFSGHSVRVYILLGQPGKCPQGTLGNSTEWYRVINRTYKVHPKKIYPHYIDSLRATGGIIPHFYSLLTFLLIRVLRIWSKIKYIFWFLVSCLKLILLLPGLKIIRTQDSPVYQQTNVIF